MDVLTASGDEVAFAENFTAGRRHAEDRNLPIRFYLGAKQDMEATKREGRPVFVDVPFIEIPIPGDKTNVMRREVWDAPGVENCDTARWPKEWEAFKAGREQGPRGTSLARLPGITEARRMELQHFNVHTIEQLAAMSDSHAMGGMGLMELKQRAQAWLDVARGNAPLQAAKEALAEERAARISLEQRLAALEQAASPEVAKRGPGRPPKNVEG